MVLSQASYSSAMTPATSSGGAAITPMPRVLLSFSGGTATSLDICAPNASITPVPRVLLSFSGRGRDVLGHLRANALVTPVPRALLSFSGGTATSSDICRT